MNKIGLIFPHQLFEDYAIFKNCETIYLIEEQLYFKQFAFHKRKLAFHRSSMKSYEQVLKENGLHVRYIETTTSEADCRQLLKGLKNRGNTTLVYRDTIDDWLEKRIQKTSSQLGITIEKHPTLSFIINDDSFEHFANKKRILQAEFYKQQRLKQGILITADKQAIGGKWSFDEDNRKKYPKGSVPPVVVFPKQSAIDKAALAYVEKYFQNNPGQLDEEWNYPTTTVEAKKFFQQFLEQRFALFGDYEDALLQNESILHHSVISPMLNVGLITPSFVITATLDYAQQHEIALNTVEGFIRQILGWREFIRKIYEWKGIEERTKNYWGFKRKLPASFWNGTTGIAPIDSCIKKVIQTGYAHHIERLMVLGNFMLLCEFDPNEVYKWFMTFFIDGYDWVMVPNVYGMSQFADGGLMATKPYISGSNYLMKMGDYKKGPWTEIWDALFWRFMHTHRDFFLSNPRLSMLVRTFDKMPEDKKNKYLQIAEQYLATLD